MVRPTSTIELQALIGIVLVVVCWPARAEEIPGELSVKEVVFLNPTKPMTSADLRTSVERARGTRLQQGSTGPEGEAVGLALGELSRKVIQLDTKVDRLEELVTSQKQEDEIKLIVDGEKATMFVTLVGKPRDDRNNIPLRFLRTDILNEDLVAIERLYHPSLDLTAKWADVDNRPRVQQIAKTVNAAFAPIDGNEPFLLPGTFLKIYRKKGGTEKAVVEGFLLRVDNSQISVQPGDKEDDLSEVELFTLEEIAAIFAPPENDRFKDLIGIAKGANDIDTRTVLISWKTSDKKDENLEVTYRNKVVPWKIRYDVAVNSADLKASHIKPRATVYNRTVYNWCGNVTVRLRSADPTRLSEFVLDNVALNSHASGEFAVSKDRDNPWTIEAEKTLLFDATTQSSAEGTRQTLAFDKLNGPPLAPGRVSVSLDGALFGTAASLANKMTLAGPRSTKVTVRYSPAKIDDFEKNRFEVARIDEERVTRSLTQTYTVRNVSNEDAKLKIVFATLSNWDQDREAEEVVVPKKSAEKPQDITLTVVYTETSEVTPIFNMRTASSNELMRLVTNSLGDKEKLRRITESRILDEQADEQLMHIKERLPVVESILHNYEIVESIEDNTIARRAFQREIDVLRQAEANLTLAKSQAKAAIDRAIFSQFRVEPPTMGRQYHGVFAPSLNVAEDEFTQKDLEEYEHAVNKKASFVQMAYNRIGNPEPARKAMRWISKSGRIPVVRLNVHPKNAGDAGSDTLQEIIDGRLDDWLNAWGEELRVFSEPVVVIWGGECNGHWNSWSGAHNGGGSVSSFGNPNVADGPERFAAAYRHIIRLVRDQCRARNVSWMFHVSSNDSSKIGGNDAWNRFEAYYPGDDFIDWVGVSAYGAQSPDQTYPVETFRYQMDSAYDRFTGMSPGKPVFVTEFGSTKDHPTAPPHTWAGEALTDLFAKRWPRVCGFMWWNESWPNNSGSTTNMRVQDNSDLSKTMSTILDANKSSIQEQPALIDAHTRRENWAGIGEELPVGF